MPDLQALHQKYQAQGVQVIGVALQSGTAKEVKKFVEGRKVTYTIVVPSKEKTVFDQYRVEAFPTMYVVDQKGVVRFVSVGHDEAGILKTIKSLMKP